MKLLHLVCVVLAAFVASIVSYAQSPVTGLQETAKEAPQLLQAFLVNASKNPKDADFKFVAKPLKTAKGDVMDKLYVEDLKLGSRAAREGVKNGRVIYIQGVSPQGLTWDEFYAKIERNLSFSKDKDNLKIHILSSDDPGRAKLVKLSLVPEKTLTAVAGKTLASTNE